MNVLPLTAITIPPGRRDPGDVAALAASIREVGLLHPLAVTPDHRLIAGWRRLNALRLLGWTEVPVTVVARDDLHTELVELDENLERQDLSALQHADALKRRKELYEALHPETRHVTERGGPGRGNKTDANSASVFPPRFGKDAAEKTGQSERTIQREVQIAEHLTPRTRAAIAGTSVEYKKTDLLDLARLPPEAQEDAAGRLASGDAASVREAVRQRHQERAEGLVEALDDGSIATAEYRKSYGRARRQVEQAMLGLDPATCALVLQPEDVEPVRAFSRRFRRWLDDHDAAIPASGIRLVG